MKKQILLLLSMAVTSCMLAQNKDEAIYVFKEDWTPAKNYESAFYFMHVTKENDSSYIARSYTKTGPMVKWETFKDKNTEIPHGKFAYYNSNGKIDSSGYVFEGRKDSSWLYKNAEGKLVIEEKFNRGKLVKRINYINGLITYPDGSTEELKDKKDVSPTDSADKKDNNAFVTVQTEAQHKGGVGGWNQYLQKNMKTPERFINLHKKESFHRGTVIAIFDINQEGSVDRVFIEQSCEWSTDTEVIRVLTASPKWKPAMQNGKPVRYRHKQSLSFVVSE